MITVHYYYYYIGADGRSPRGPGLSHCHCDLLRAREAADTGT